MLPSAERRGEQAGVAISSPRVISTIPIKRANVATLTMSGAIHDSNGEFRKNPAAANDRRR